MARRFRSLTRWAARALAAAAAIAVVALVGGYLWLRTSLPQLAGTAAVAGIAAPVEVARDRDGIPTISAATERDAHFAIGFVHAQDRLWQMDFTRRLGAGRLAEVLGARAAGSDRFMRTLGLYRLAEQSYDGLMPEVRAALDAYAAGVNAFLATHPGSWPPEFVALGYRPEPWRPADSLVWSRQMALMLTGNWRHEVLRARLASRLTPRQLDDLWPAGDDGVPSTLRSEPAVPEVNRHLAGLLSAWPEPLLPTQASNSWTVSGAFTASGKPLLANDPHLGYRAPGVWYLARIAFPGLTVTGATAPGVPFPILGHNLRIAWGMTTTGSDTQDLYLERIDPADPARYLTPEGARRFDLRHETIRVRGGPDETVTVRSTRHGPVISDVMRELGPVGGADVVVALASPALEPDDRTAEAIFLIARAGDWRSFLAATERFHSPQQNITYADVDGNIGFVAPGRVPVRRNGNGLVPAPGWTADHDWSGVIPFAALPKAFNPTHGRIVSANHRIVGEGYPYFLSNDWAPPYRARRIHQLLDATPRHTPETMAAMQMDAMSLMARELLALMLARPGGGVIAPADPRARDALARLASWDGRMDRNRPEPLIFTAWLRALNRLIYADELGADFVAFWELRPQFIERVLTRRPEWCDDIATPVAESCAERIERALIEALAELGDAFGSDIGAWRWGDAHYAHFRHGLFGFVPVLRSLADLRIATDGDGFTLNRADSRINNPRNPYADVHGPGLRAVYDLAALDRSLFALAAGQSGNLLSADYGNLLQRWRDGDTFTLPRAPVAVLRLLPLENR